MSALPPALRPWASQLALFPKDLALHLGPYVARLSAALGSLRPRGEADGGEPQGYDGLTRRGTFDRLLVSEWLWALEAPDELVRRAAFGELSFLKPAFRQPQGARRTVALLDAGPDQLGAPRIAHLALLIVLSRRAEAAGAAFSWGVLQADPGKGVFSEVTPGTLGTWLAARDVAPATESRLAAWREALSLDAAPEDAWLVGDARLSRLPGATGMSRVEVAEVLAPGARQLSVRVRPASRAERSVVLDLPPPDTSVRLLRDPFLKTRAAPVVTPLTRMPALRSFAFSADGRRLLLYRQDGSVGAMAIPHSPRSTVPRARRVTPPPEQLVLGMGWRQNGGLIVLARKGADGDFVLHGKLRSASRLKAESDGEPFLARESHPLMMRWHPGLPPGRLLSCEDGFGNERLLLAGLTPFHMLSEAPDNLYLLEEERSARRVEVSIVKRGITAAAEVNRKVVFTKNSLPSDAGPESPETWLGVVERDGIVHLPLGKSVGKAYFGFTATNPHPEAGLVAVCRQPGLWSLFLGGGAAVDVELPPSWRVVGAGLCQQSPSEPGVLALDDDQRTVWLVNSGCHRVKVAPEDVVHAEASHALPVLGLQLKGGGLMLIHLLDGGILYNALPGTDG